MHILERILLYAVSVISITLLLGKAFTTPPQVPESSAQVEKNPVAQSEPLPEFEPLPMADPEPIGQTAVALLKDSPKPPGEQPSENGVVLRDGGGQARIELKLGSRDEPSILLNDQAGREIISLTVDQNGQGRIGLRHNHHRLDIGPDEKGDLAVVLKGDETEEIRLSLSGEGEARLIAKGRSKSTLALSSRSDGAADIQIHRGSKSGGPLMSLQSDGEASIGIANNNREYGPVMHLFDDGLGQLSINGAGSESGPTLIRTSDGTSIISVRHPNGQPAASMVGSPTGASLLAVTNTAGTQQAALRSDKEGKVAIGVTESRPDEKPAPKPVPRPPKPPQIELILHQPVFPEDRTPTVASAETRKSTSQ